jgi:hypothetical protein
VLTATAAIPPPILVGAAAAVVLKTINGWTKLAAMKAQCGWIKALCVVQWSAFLLLMMCEGKQWALQLLTPSSATATINAMACISTPRYSREDAFPNLAGRLGLQIQLDRVVSRL